jgi:hypothetical protein
MEKHYIFGSTCEPLLVANPEELASVIAGGELEKATEVIYLIINDARTSNKTLCRYTCGVFKFHYQV